MLARAGLPDFRLGGLGVVRAGALPMSRTDRMSERSNFMESRFLLL
jgi:hypothetical protein